VPELRPLLSVALLSLLATTVACSNDDGGTTIVGGGTVLFEIPWNVPETNTYRLTEEDDELGSAELAIEAGPAGNSSFIQEFDFPNRDITDDVEALANAETLAPATVTRAIDSPDGARNWDVTYESSEVTVVQSTDDDERTDTIDIPQTSYDTWTDLFLWRTIDFREGYEVRYQGVVTADFAKPDVISIVLKVTGLETVTVPAGTFDAWRMEIRSGGRTQKAWIADDAERTLVRYDNTEIVFELQP
jgi:uncharacterized protein DUF3108